MKQKKSFTFIFFNLSISNFYTPAAAEENIDSMYRV
jgi:hypothetical protein